MEGYDSELARELEREWRQQSQRRQRRWGVAAILATAATLFIWALAR